MKPKNTRNCECCHKNYATGKEYGEYCYEFFNLNVEVKGLCEFCNVNNIWFSCPKHGVEYKIGNKTYQPN